MVKQAGLVFFILWILAGPVFAAGVTVRVNPEASVAGPQVLVGDLAVVSGDDSGKVKAVRELKLGNAPLPGQRLVFTAELFTARLIDAGADFSNVSWEIPPMVTVVAEGQTIQKKILEEVATEAIRQRLAVPVGGKANDVIVTAVGMPRDVVVPLGEANFRAELPYGIRLAAPTVVNVIISTDGRVFTTVSLKFDVKVWREVLVANRNIAAFELVTPDSVRLERWDISHLTGYVTDAGKVAGLRTRHSVVAGAPISEAALEKPPIVKRGRGVTILAQTGGITVTASGQALQAGCQGAMIRVQNLTTNRIVNARVIDEATVEVIIYNGR